jgi:uncharacterized membrane protein
MWSHGFVILSCFPDSFSVLKENLQNIFSFGISFFVLILIWKVHYNFFRRIKIIDNWIVTINMLLLFVVLFFVYPLKFLVNLSFGKGVISSYSELSELFQLYGLGFTLIFLFVSLLYYYASKKSLNNKEEMKYYFRHFLIFTIIGLCSIIIAKIEIGINFGLPGFIYCLLGPICYWHGKKYQNKKE